jgi:hypothetical protein
MDVSLMARLVFLEAVLSHFLLFRSYGRWHILMDRSRCVDCFLCFLILAGIFYRSHLGRFLDSINVVLPE